MTRWSLFLQTLSLLHHFLGLYSPLLDVEVKGGDPDSPVIIANTLVEVFIQDRHTTRLAEIARLEALAAAQGTTDTSALVAAQFSTLGSMSIVEQAYEAEASVTPSIRKNMLLAGFLGLFLGVVLVFFLDYSSNKIKSVDQVDRLFQLDDTALHSQVPAPLLGVIFEWNSKEVSNNTLEVHANPESIYSEMFRQVRTGFQFATANRPGKSFVITSVGPQEGKSTILSNLGASLAQGGNQVIIVDSDLRRPTLHKFAGLDRRRGGLSGLMLDSQLAASQLRETEVPGLRVLLSGPVPPNPADLVGSARMDQVIDELKGECDYLLLDSPPIMAAADSTILAAKADGVLMVVTMGETRTDTFRDALQQIQRAGTPVVGYLVNKVKTQRMGYGRYRYRYNYYYYYRSEEEGETAEMGGNGAKPESGKARRRSAAVSSVRKRVRHFLNRNSHRRR